MPWYIVASSQIGSSHIANSTVCQDANYFEILTENCGFAVVADGAGTAANSDRGAAIVARELAPVWIKDYINKLHLDKGGKLPGNDEWQRQALELFKSLRAGLNDFAVKEDVPFSSLASTAIVLIYTSQGLLITHIGDGRAAFCDGSKTWKALIKPHKGEEANQTVFVTSPIWEEGNLVLSNVNVPESKSFPCEVRGFALMSDGCENHTFICSVIDELSGKWNDPNQPFEKFFDPVTETLLKMSGEGAPVSEANELWDQFLMSGNGFAKEHDDKTIIFGVKY